MPESEFDANDGIASWFGRLDPDQCQQLHEASLTIVERTGVRLYHQEAIDLLTSAGAGILEGNRVRIPAHLVERALSTTPKQVTLYDQHGEPALELAGHKSYFGTGCDCLNIVDHRSWQRRPAVLQDDHCPRPIEKDQARQRPGASGLEMWLALLFSFGVRSGRLSLNRWVDVCCTQPAQLYGLSHKGHLNPGYDADLVLFDPERKVTLGPEQLHTPLSFSSYEGIRVTGYPVTTISRGEVIVEQGQLMGEPGRGRFVARSYD